MPEQFSIRHIGDRRDGRRLYTLASDFLLMPHLVRSPADAVNSFTDRIETTAIDNWIETQQHLRGLDISLMHVFIASYVRTLSLCPALNRFVAGRYLYARRSIDIVLSGGRSASSDGGSMTAKLRFLPADTIFDVCRKINTQVDSLRADEDTSRMERFTGVLVKTPRFVIRFGVSILRWLDYHGWLAESITERSRFHGSAVISDEGANGMPPISRSLNSIGTIPVSLSVGRRSTVTELNDHGQPERRRYLDYTVSFDSRIADSAYISLAFRTFRRCLSDPSILSRPPERVNDDTI